MLSVIIKASVTLLALGLSAKGNHQKEHSKVDDPPCFFNPLCTCSKAFPDLGRITCKDVPLLTVPQHINASKVFMLHLENNGLRHVEPFFFKHTGVSRIEISQNILTNIQKETFTGLELSLWELNLRHNRFRKVPNESFRFLQKLKLLNLSGNQISNVKADDWLGLEQSLKILILSNNKLFTLRPRTFSVLQQLESLDLSGNSFYEFDTTTFENGPSRLNELNLADNLLSSVPLQELSELRELRLLDLSFNQITDIRELSHDRSNTTPVRTSLDIIRLDYNQIQYLPAESFKSFPTLSRTYLNGNPIKYIEKGAFKFSKIREIYFEDCEISELTMDTFSGLEKSLEILNLEGNNLTDVPSNFFKEFTSLKSLNLKDNFLKKLNFAELSDHNPFSLEHLDASGLKNSVVDFHQLKKLHNLRSLALSQVIQPSLSYDNLPEFLFELEEIKITYSNVKNLRNHAFKNFRGLRKLILTENSISSLEDEVFSEIGHSLFYLSLANGLSSTVAQLPFQIFQHLTAVEILDLSNNNLKALSEKQFHSMKRLKTILIQDNFIEIIPKRMFQGDIHLEITSIQLSFNQLSFIETQSFADLIKLEYLWLNDNRIKTIERRAFMNLPKLKYLYLEGNKIAFLREEDLPELEKLDLAYNKIKAFNYDFFDQVGTLSSFSLNLSHNAIERLTTNLTFSDHPNLSVLHVNIRALDLSHNNISYIVPGFFKPIESSVTHIYLSHNKLLNITRNVFGGMIHLQWLDISCNSLIELEQNAFTNTKNIQVLYLSSNHLKNIPKHFLKDFHRLRILDLKNNGLRSLPHNLFGDGQIERLDISNNHLSAFPINSFDAASAVHLCELDLSENEIAALPSPEVFAMFNNLYRLNLSKNRLIRLEDGTFSFLHRLHSLDISHNTDLTLDSKQMSFNGLANTLEDLILKNLSLNVIPPLRLGSLKSLDVSGNRIFTVPYEFSHNLSQLERIELSDNEMVNVPPSITALTKLQSLSLSGNPLESINFQQSFSLRNLDLRNTSLNALEKGALRKLPLLENLKISIHSNIKNFNIPQLIRNNYGLKDLYIEVLENADLLENQLKGTFPSKLKNLTLAGRGLRTVPRNLMQNIQGPHLNFVLFNTSVQEIVKDVFDNAKNIRNLTLNVKSNKLKTMFNPNTADSPNIPKKLFLLNLLISNNDWICDCSVGWIEVWERKKRQYLCENNSEDCFLASEDLRSAICSNRKPGSLFEVFKQDLECGWNNSRNLKPSIELKFLTLAFSFGFCWCKNLL